MPQSESNDQVPPGVPLFVDLDGTLVGTDTSVEASFRLLRRSFTYLLRLPFWLLSGRAHLKRMVSERVPLDAENLPYKVDFLDFLRAEHRNGRRIILATAADEAYARAVADYLGIFDGAIGSDGHTDLAGRRKLERMLAVTGGGPFDYAADDLEDLVIFPKARKAIIAHPLPAVRLAAQRMSNIERIFDTEPRRIIDNLHALRPKRFVVNLLVFLPLLLTGELAAHWDSAVIAFLCCCAGAASSYIYSDLLNIAGLRRLAPEQRGAIADGKVAVQRAAQAVPLLAILSLLLAAWVSAAFLLAIASILIVALLTLQDRFPLPRIIASITLGLLRSVAGLALLPALAPLWVIVVCAVAGVACGALAEQVNRAKIGYV